MVFHPLGAKISIRNDLIHFRKVLSFEGHRQGASVG